jgi:hypothetical protein
MVFHAVARQLLILTALFATGCAEVRPREARPVVDVSYIAPRAATRNCEFLSVYVYPPDTDSYDAAVEHGIMTEARARRAEDLSRRLSSSVARSLGRRGFDVVASPESPYWIATTQAEASRGTGRFIAVVKVRRAEGKAADLRPNASSVSPGVSADGLSALVDSYQWRLDDAAGDIADQAARLLLPHAVELCEARATAREAKELQRTRDALVEEMRGVREERRKHLDLSAEESPPPR